MIEERTRISSVREVTAALLRALGMTTVFGNPGSTELKFLKDWPRDFRYVMALHEGNSVAMADAYAQQTGNAALANLHSAGGVGNAMGAIFTAYRNQAPLVILAGQQTRAMLADEPFLFSAEATLLPKPYVKWSVEPARAEDVPAALARAYYVAMQRPYGPTFVSVPEDDWERPAPHLPARRIYADFAADQAGIDALGQALGRSRTPVIVVGSGVDRDRAAALVVRLAERTGAKVWASALASRSSYPENHPLFAGSLPRTRTGVTEALHGHDLVLVLGAPVFNYHIHTEGPYVNEGTELFQVTDDWNAAASAGTGTSIISSIAPALERLIPLLAAAPPLTAPERVPPSVPATDPISIAYVLQAIARTLPPDAILTEETPSAHSIEHDYLPLRPGAFLSAASGSLGYGLPAAVGAALAAPGRRVLALIGDGSAHYSIQALWTAAQWKLPITFVIVNNEGYGAMKSFTQLMGSTRSPSFDLPGVDFGSLARGYGCEAQRVERAAELQPALEKSFASSGPVLIDVMVDTAAVKLR